MVEGKSGLSHHRDRDPDQRANNQPWYIHAMQGRKLFCIEILNEIFLTGSATSSRIDSSIPFPLLIFICFVSVPQSGFLSIGSKMVSINFDHVQLWTLVRIGVRGCAGARILWLTHHGDLNVTNGNPRVCFAGWCKEEKQVFDPCQEVYGQQIAV